MLAPAPNLRPPTRIHRQSSILAQSTSALTGTISDAFEKDHPVTLSIALIWAISLYIAMEDVKVAHELLDRFTARAELHSLEPYLAAARAYRGLLAVRSGDADSGVPMLKSALADLHAAKYELFTTTFTIALARGVAEIGSNDEALTVLGEAIAGVTASGDVSHMPDLLRAKGNLLLKGGYREEAVEECLSEAITWSRDQGAVISELAATIDLATLPAEGNERRENNASKRISSTVRGVREPTCASGRTSSRSTAIGPRASVRDEQERAFRTNALEVKNGIACRMTAAQKDIAFCWLVDRIRLIRHVACDYRRLAIVTNARTT
ncbi:hypothetical protein EV291_1336 [Rhizobium sp. BK068]|nr:hypothetical protein EV291_1336 [Rhizobium sp. BK068]